MVEQAANVPLVVIAHEHVAELVLRAQEFDEFQHLFGVATFAENRKDLHDDPNISS